VASFATSFYSGMNLNGPGCSLGFSVLESVPPGTETSTIKAASADSRRSQPSLSNILGEVEAGGNDNEG